MLLRDLCGRLPYNVCVHIRYKTGEPCYGKLTLKDIQWFIDSKIENIKPYLRPMSSMTEEEDLEFIGIGLLVVNYGTNGNAKHKCKLSIPEIDWLNKHHFDYLGLISKGLALEAPKDMYNF